MQSGIFSWLLVGIEWTQQASDANRAGVESQLTVEGDTEIVSNLSLGQMEAFHSCACCTRYQLPSASHPRGATSYLSHRFPKDQRGVKRGEGVWEAEVWPWHQSCWVLHHWCSCCGIFWLIASFNGGITGNSRMQSSWWISFRKGVIYLYIYR